MQILNLINPEKSKIFYEIIHFPDGETHIKLGEINRKDSVQVKCRIRNGEELFIIAQVGDILNRQGIEWGLDIYYLMSMRMDRVISFNESFSLKVVTDIINNLNPLYVFLHHVHSTVSFRKFSPYIRNVQDLDSQYFTNLIKGSEYQICFPDKGAYQRYFRHITYPVLLGEKVRNVNTGKIESIIISNPDDYNKDLKKVLIIDDLCDGGGTFVGIAEALRKIDPDVNLTIDVFHMVNRKGIDNLSRAFDKVFFTNSYQDWNNLPSNCEIINVIEDEED